MQAITELDGDIATVRALHNSDHARLAGVLLAAAGPGNARAVRTISVKGGGRAFQVTAAIAYAAGLIPDVADPPQEPGDSVEAGASAADDGQAVEPVKKAPVKKAPAKKAAPKAAGDVE